MYGPLLELYVKFLVMEQVDALILGYINFNIWF